MKRDYKLYLKDILSAMESVQMFVKGMSYEEFSDDDKTTSAVIKKFEIIGEATKQIPEAVKQKYPEIPWKEMAGMRDRLVHFYFGIDYKLVWESIKKRIPKVKPLINKILKELSS